MKITVDLFKRFDAIIPQLRRDIRELTRDEYKELSGLLRAIKNGACTGSLNKNMLVKNKPMYDLLSAALWSVVHAFIDQNHQWRDIVYNAAECGEIYKPEKGKRFFLRYNYNGDSRKWVHLEDAIRDSKLIRM